MPNWDGGHCSTSWASLCCHQPRCHEVPAWLGPSGSAPTWLSPDDQDLLCTLVTHLCPVGGVKVDTWQNKDERDATVWMTSLWFSQNGLVAEMGKLFLHI